MNAQSVTDANGNVLTVISSGQEKLLRAVARNNVAYADQSTVEALARIVRTKPAPADVPPITVPILINAPTFRVTCETLGRSVTVKHHDRFKALKMGMKKLGLKHHRGLVIQEILTHG